MQPIYKVCGFKTAGNSLKVTLIFRPAAHFEYKVVLNYSITPKFCSKATRPVFIYF